MDLWEIAVVVITGFCSGVIKTGVGIGSGVFLLPTLSLAFPAKFALGLGAPMMLASDIWGLRYYWKQWAPTGIIVRLLLAAIPGLLVGTLLLPVIPAKFFRLCVGVFGAFYAISMLWPSFPPVVLLKSFFQSVNRKYADKRIYFYGMLGGVSTVLAHAGGLVWSIYLLDELKDKRTIVGTYVLLFCVTNIYKVIAYIYIGNYAAVQIAQIRHCAPCFPAWRKSVIRIFNGKPL
ncbi:MAG: sulfite exporter TauE/SafE family protein [Desulfovibrio sp.]|jgi:uncharacterized membrane protein YfcA|nr:sulfite exporter TauE/SafE family protein [Desulfovibrio sp.]